MVQDKQLNICFLSLALLINISIPSITQSIYQGVKTKSISLVYGINNVLICNINMHSTYLKTFHTIFFSPIVLKFFRIKSWHIYMSPTCLFEDYMYSSVL